MEQSVNTSSPKGKEGKKPSFLGMIWEPGQQFERIREQPRIVVPLLVVVVLMVVLSVAMVEPTMELPEHQAGIDQLGEDAYRSMTYVGASIGMMFIVPLLILISTLLHWLLTLLLQGRATFAQLFSFNTYLSIFGILSMAVYAVYLWTVGVGEHGDVYPTSLAAFIPAEGFLKGLLSGIEVFSIWQLIVTALGLSAIAGVSRGKGWVAALIPFLLVLLVMAGFVAIGEAVNMDMNVE
ncbi:YIP1 family protein [Desmospora profundinema]|uniref:Yip1 domain-containing protein n=1 Tax=Desmospora profundinema TaxID=1571184 RepID=A0ABU1IQD5_9BACL|nr:YIP1 family protein [Desmospora profundinema]MDR6227021.1 hypothetical protein [Desmospora profundinema]